MNPFRHWVLGFVLALLVVAGAIALYYVRRETTDARVAREIQEVVRRDSIAARRKEGRPATDEQAIAAYYRRRHFHPVWSQGEGPTGRAFELIRALQQCRREGLDPADYAAGDLGRILATLPRPELFGQHPHPERLAELDVRLTRTWLRCARDLADGRVAPSHLDPDWWTGRDTIEAGALLQHTAAHGSPRRWLERLTPREPEYLRLREALERYRRIATAGGWGTLPPGPWPKLERGLADPLVDSLRVRLARDGDFEGAPLPGPFDRALARALRRFQARHGLAADGRLGPATLEALDVPVEWRIRQIEMNLERRRWVGDALREPYLTVNVPDFRLALVDSGRTVLGMNVVVGRRDNPTPTFSDAVTFIEMNPTWRLPKRIVVEEVLPAWKRDPEHLVKNQMRVFLTKAATPVEVRADSIDWTAVEEDSFPFLVRQDAGPENPLGRIKFMCPNEYDVYLHDTPMKGLFRAGARDRSHGCVRVELPESLAVTLLRGTPVGGRDSLDAILASGNWRRFRLKPGMPVHVLYWTAWVDSAGTTQFRNDVYGLDERLARAIRERTADRFVLNPPLEWGEKHRNGAAATGERAP